MNQTMGIATGSKIKENIGINIDSGVLYVHVEGEEQILCVSILNQNGQTIMINATPCLSSEMHIKHLSNGVYFVAVRTTAGNILQKIIKNE